MFAPDHLLALAPVVQDAGFAAVAVPDSVFFPEHVSADYPYSPDGSRFWPADTPFVDPLIAVAAMSALTTNLRFVTNVVKAPLRHPLLLAKEVASVASLNSGRLQLGVGLSWIPEEFEWLGTSMRTRGARLDEAIDIISMVCGGGGPQWVEYHGKHYDFGRLMVSPAPDAAVPIIIGGHSEPALARAARVGDGWISVQTTTDEVRAIVSQLAELRADADRSDVPFDIVALCLDIPPDASGIEAFATLGAEIADAGMRAVFQVVPWFFTGGDPGDLDVRRRALTDFGTNVIAPLSAG
jgi:probable F420-dependent oxidoreductase